MPNLRPIQSVRDVTGPYPHRTPYPLPELNPPGKREIATINPITY
jgi:hypothetical protein